MYVCMYMYDVQCMYVCMCVCMLAKNSPIKQCNVHVVPTQYCVCLCMYLVYMA